jgi:hypothetical protein
MSRSRPILWLLALVFIGLVFGQTMGSSTRGQITGTVVDQNGETIPGVTVIATSSKMQGERAVQTNSVGEFNLAGLPAGVYMVRFTMQGHQTIEMTDVTVRLGSIVPISTTMQKGTFTETVSVTAAFQLLETKTANVSTNLTSDQIDQLPTRARTFVDMARYVPSVTGMDFNTSDPTGGGAPTPSFRGEGQYGDNYLVDGLSVRDPSIKTAGTPLNQDAIEEIQMVTDGFSPEYSGSLGGSINAITKSGSNNLGGEVGYLFRSDDTSAEFKSVLLSQPEGFERSSPYLNIGGPIIKDKLWFFASYNRTENENNFASATLEGFGELAPGTQTTDSDLFFGKLTFAINDSHNVAVNYTERSQDTAGLDAAIATPEARAGQEVEDDRVRLNYQWVINANSLFEAKFGTVDREITTVPLAGLGPAQIEIIDFGLLTNNAWRNSSDTRSREDYTLTYTQFFNLGSGSHELKGGVDYRELNQDSGDFFSGIDEDVISIGMNPAVLDDFGLADTFSDGVKFQVTVDSGDMVPVILNEYRSGGVLNNKNEESGFFLQDRFEYGNFNFMIGARLDKQEGFSDTGATYFEYDYGDAFAPRGSVTWDYKGTGRNILKTGWGVFMDTTSLRLGEFANERESFAFRSYDWVGDDDDDYCNSAITPGCLPGLDLMNTANWAFNHEQSNSSNALDYSGLMQPAELQRFLFEYDRQIGDDYVAKFRFVDGQTRKLVDDIHYLYNDWRVENTNLKRRDYQSFEVEFNGQLTENISFNTSFVHSEAEGTNPGQFELSGFLGSSGSGANIGVYLDRPASAGDTDYWCDYFGTANCTGWDSDDPTHDFNDDDVIDKDDRDIFIQNLFGGLGGTDGDDGWSGLLPYSVDDLVKVNARINIPQWADTYVVLFGQYGSGYRNSRYGFQPAYGDFLSFSENGVVNFDFVGDCDPGDDFADCTTVSSVTPVEGQDFGTEQGLSRGTNTSADFWSVDMSIGKVFNVGNRVTVEVRGEFFNLLNKQPSLANQNRAVSNFGTALARQAPRSARGFVRIAF